MRFGVKMKFEQNPHLKKKLLDTGTRTLVEASPVDTYWGIGMGMWHKEVFDRSKWGKNHLGQILMEERTELSRSSHASD
jgi:ribA/ribD-fused uncharacterized protein